MMFSVDAWIVLGVISACLVALIFSRRPPDMILCGGVVVLLLLGVLSPKEALAGMSNEGMVTVGVLFIVAQALSETGVVSWISHSMLGRPKSARVAQLRLMAPVAAFSTILNNTPVVAMMIPAVRDWAKRNNLPVSQLMIPLSYAAIVGGTCTLIGTSTNLVVNGMLLHSLPEQALGMFDLAWVGLPCVVLVIGFTILTSRRLLPSSKGKSERFGDTRQYIVEMMVDDSSPMIGQSIEEAGLRQLPAMFLIEIVRDERLMTVVSPKEILMAGDRLIFAGDVRSVVDLKNFHGLRLAEDQAFKLGENNLSRCLAEVVISPNFPHLGRMVRDMKFRNNYGAAIIAISRNGEQLKGRIGDVELEPGDTLLLEAYEDFVPNQRYSRDFLLVSEIENSRPVRHEHRFRAGIIMVAMVAVVAVGWLSMLKAAFLAAGLLVATRCIRAADARRSVDWQILLVIAASIALGGSLESTGAAAVIAGEIVGAAAGSPIATLVAIFVVTTLFSAVISNLAAAVIVFPIALAASQQLEVSMLPFAVTLMMAASASFATPIGYQTNLMVYGPGDYRFSDFFKIGVPLTVLVGVTTILIVPLVWPF
ncbi:TrkA-C domain-containing protein [gamma proteobacterium BDW918]|jgi:di/tricarboxylate transporter|uniref:Potassium transporter TrkA n=1 Tax=Zhongshania aliphaticivorans TaxID=1470434 RepID=A0A127M488_9GAMM|nr:SLC13 family permease [Zhongshania aliphaticivorans]AMO67991.1 potassium transporter TrkA [Zhongshania aliphaticivorans]EIF44441.1 TrkA-C domain-containing protein [gamma proteobacterium BDW918]|tara:strand:- start:4323 stop:6098 length:1776 start_codon:yes stop_codon:yes gene_type:complete